LSTTKRWDIHHSKDTGHESDIMLVQLRLCGGYWLIVCTAKMCARFIITPGAQPMTLQLAATPASPTLLSTPSTGAAAIWLRPQMGGPWTHPDTSPTSSESSSTTVVHSALTTSLTTLTFANSSATCSSTRATSTIMSSTGLSSALLTTSLGATKLRQLAQLTLPIVRIALWLCSLYLCFGSTPSTSRIDSSYVSLPFSNILN
ncbi:hypothetical protein FRC11_001671, partial [Ceratobasidium sp. 423]